MLLAAEDGSEPISSSYDNHSTNDNDSSLKLLEEGAKDHHNASSDPKTTVVLQVQVQDTGPGIEAERLERIFEPYSQALHYRHYGGTGLGLSILDRLTQIMGGSIRVHSEVGQGSTFTVYIPVRVPSTNNRRPAAEQDASSNSIPQVLSTAMAAMEQDSTTLLENPTMVLKTSSRRKVMPAIEEAPPTVATTTITAPGESETETNGPIFSAKIETGDPPPPSLPIAPPEPPTTPPKPRISFSPPSQRTTKTPFSSPSPSPLKCYVRKSSSEMLKETFDFDPNENIVLVVDDNAMNRKLFGRMLSQFHIQHEYAVHGAEAVDYMRKSRNCNPQNQNAPNVGLILMDWSMPVMDGCQAIQAIRNDLGLKHIPIVAVTACALEARKEELLEAGANELATKPLLRDDLYEKCQRYLLWPPKRKKATSEEVGDSLTRDD
jgi:CheY-like chemotaxis protein